MTTPFNTRVRPDRPIPSRALQQRNQRVNQYRALVTPIAVHYCRRCPEPLDDLLQVGLLGLLRAAELYQAKTATPFEAFARPHIRGAILHYLRDSAQAVRLPRRQMELHDKLRQLRAGWCARHGGEPSAEELREALALNRQQWQDLLRGQAMARPSALMTATEDTLAAATDGEESWLDPMGPEPTLLVQLSRLEPCLRLVIQKVVLSGWTYRRTAALLQVSPMTVQRRLKRGLAQLKDALNAPLVEPSGSSRRPSRSQTRHPVASAAPAC
jgi:RNA polymerase sigma-B factor